MRPAARRAGPAGVGEFYVLGLGVDPIGHATLEVLQAAGRCDRLHCQGLDAEQIRHMAAYCPRGAMARGFPAGSPESLVGAILGDLGAGRRVGLATWGHPFYWSGLGGRLVAQCEARGIPWRTFGSISPAAVAISAAGVALGRSVFGLQCFDGARIAAFPAVLSAAWPLVLYFPSAPTRDIVERMVERLRSRYPKDHPVLFCSSANNARPTTLQDLVGRRPGLASGTVLYLPARGAGRGDSRKTSRRRGKKSSRVG